METLALLTLAVLALVGGEWAEPVNTGLLIALAYLAQRNGRKTDGVQTHLQVVGTDVSNAAAAAAHAAAAAADAARITKEIGGHFRAPASLTETAQTETAQTMERGGDAQ